MNGDHKKTTVTCITCLRTYCSGCDSDCPSCCIHRHCQAQLVDEKGITDIATREMERAQEELLVAKRNAESWQETAQQIQEERDYWLRMFEDMKEDRDGLDSLLNTTKSERDVATKRAEATEERGKLLYAWLDYYVHWFVEAKRRLKRLRN